MTSALRTGAITLGGLIILLAYARPTGACTCIAGPGETAWPTLEQSAAAADAVLIGRVLASKSSGDSRPAEGGVRYVDLEITESIKGLEAKTRVRVWDGGFGTSCTADLRPLPEGTLVAMAVEHNSPESSQYHELLGLSVAPDDYLVGSCGEHLRVLKTNREASKVARGLRKVVRRSSRAAEQ